VSGAGPASANRGPPERRRLAIGLALAVAVVLPVVDAMVKRLVAEYPVVMVAWARMGLVAIIIGGVGGSQLGLRMLRPVAGRLQVLRGASAVLGTSMVFLGFQALPLAECLSIVSIAPVLANLFSRWWLDEPGDRFSWMAALASFAGVLVIARPGVGVFSAAAVYPVLGAIGLASFLATTRAVAGRDDPRVTAFLGPLVAFVAFSAALPFNWVAPARVDHLLLFLAIGVLAAAAQVMQAFAFRHGSSHLLAPISYASLPVAIVVGWGAFGALPDGWSLAGMAVIAAAGIATLLRK
jgi:drug/metabolite transporter (DMT)-like permease